MGAEQTRLSSVALANVERANLGDLLHWLALHGDREFVESLHDSAVARVRWVLDLEPVAVPVRAK